jgi:hypothetical protein
MPCSSPSAEHGLRMPPVPEFARNRPFVSSRPAEHVDTVRAHGAESTEKSHLGRGL